MLSETDVMTRDAIWAFKEKASKLKLRLIEIEDRRGVGIVRLVKGKRYGSVIKLHTVDLPRYLSAYEKCSEHMRAIARDKASKK
jgi:hypothetical protein